MSDTFKATGSCLCGSVIFSANQASAHVGACHCGMCRKWGGGPLMVSPCESEVSFEVKENITVYNSSDWAEREFCRQCSSHLFYRHKESQQHFIPLGLFDDQQKFIFDHQVCIDLKPKFYEFANATRNLTEAELFASAGAS